MKYVVLLYLLGSGIQYANAQQYLELIETNINVQQMEPYIDTYTWTKNVWLSGGMLPDTLRGGNAISKAASGLNSNVSIR